MNKISKSNSRMCKNGSTLRPSGVYSRNEGINTIRLYHINSKKEKQVMGKKHLIKTNAYSWFFKNQTRIQGNFVWIKVIYKKNVEKTAYLTATYWQGRSLPPLLFNIQCRKKKRMKWNKEQKSKIYKVYKGRV